MPSDASFHAERKTGIGGSDIAAILGMSPWRTPYEVWLEKTGRSDPPTGTLAMRHGTYVEEFVAREYASTTGRQVERYNALLRHPDIPLIGHIDRLVIPDGAKIASHKRVIRTNRGLECKAVNAYSLGRDGEWGEPGTDQVPKQYLLQVAAYQALTGCELWDLAALFGNNQFRIYSFRRDPELEDYILTEVDDWWRHYVEADTPPDPQTAAEAKLRWPRHSTGKILQATVDIRDRLHRLAQIKANIRELEDMEQAIKDALYPALADAEVVTDAGEEIASFRANKDSQKIDFKKLALDMLANLDPNEQTKILDTYAKSIPGARVLRLSKSLEIT